jgi:hypothetical protein
MEVYLVPVGGDRYELYSEAPDEPPAVTVDASRGVWKRLQEYFQTVLATIEREHGHGRPERLEADAGRGWFERARNRVLRWTAERVAEQRLLWHLRRQAEARIVAPDDLPAERARDMVRSILQHDADRHRRWLVVNAVAFVASAPIALLPGPNIVAYYFAFRLVGHYLSMHGARHGASGVRWQSSPSPELTRLRSVTARPAAERERQVDEIAHQLGLRRLSKFFARTARVA